MQIENEKARQNDAPAIAEALLNDRPYDEPTDAAAASATVDALGSLLRATPFFRRLIKRSLDAARQMATDPLQGMTELLQNADDVGASEMRVAVREGGRGAEILVVHDGKPVRLANALAMAAPWVSTKQADATAAGRFGIGFKIVHAFCEKVEVHAGLYHFNADGTHLVSLAAEPAIPGFYDPDRGQTLFRLQLRPRFSIDRIVAWLRDQPDENLLFLRSIRRVRLVELDGGEAVFERRLVISDGELGFEGRFASPGFVPVAHTTIRTMDGREWEKFEALIPVPPGMERAEKATAEETRISVAVPRQPGPQPLYVVFPTRLACSLPCAFDAQFDPVVSREALQETEWNKWLVDRAGELMGQVAVRLFEADPRLAWSALPLPGEGVGSDGSWLPKSFQAAIEAAREHVERHASLVADSGLPQPIGKVGYESQDLSGLLTPGDISGIDPELGGVPIASRDSAGRWRHVLSSLSGPREVELRELLQACSSSPSFEGKPPHWYVSVLALVARQPWLPDESIRSARLVVDVTGRRHRAAVRERTATLFCLGGVEIPPFAAAHGLVVVLAPEFGDGGEVASAARGWLLRHSCLVETPRAVDLLSAFASRYAASPKEVGVGELGQIRDLFEDVPEAAIPDLGTRLGAAILVEGRRNQGAGKQERVRCRPSEAYLPASIDGEPSGWPAAVGDTPGLLWISPMYEDALKTAGRRRKGDGSQRKRGAKTFFSVLGARACPRLIRSDLEASPMARASWRPAGTGVWIYDDFTSPDLVKVVADIASDKTERKERSLALFRCIARHWDRHYEGRTAASYGRKVRQGQFAFKGKVDASWLAELIDKAWYPDELGDPARPRDLVVRSHDATAIYGNAVRYAYGLRSEDARSPLALALGIEQSAPASRLVAQLERLRSGDDEFDEARVMRCYAALARQCPTVAAGSILNAMVGDVSVKSLRGKFGVKANVAGLLYDRTDGSWLSPMSYFRGKDVFRGRRRRVPSAKQLNPLWIALGIREPTIADCVRAIKEAGKEPPTPGLDEFLVNVLHHIQGLLPGEKEDRAALAKVPLVCGRSWVSQRPVYLLRNIDHVSALWDKAAHLRLWTPPCDVDAVRDLAGVLGVAEISPVVKVRDGGPMSDLGGEGHRARFEAAVAQMRSDLARNRPAMSEALTSLAWEELSAATLYLHDEGTLRIVMTEPAWGVEQVTLPMQTYLRTDPIQLHFESAEAIGDVDHGGRAIASLFPPTMRREAALAWMAAWSRSERLAPAQLIELAREEDESAKFELLAAQVNARLRQRPARPANVVGIPANGPKIEEKALRLKEPHPAMALVVAVSPGTVAGGIVQPTPTNLSGPWTPPSGGSGSGGGMGQPAKVVRQVRYYSPAELESLALHYAVLALSGSTEPILMDIRQRRGAGADATIDWRTFVEIKSFFGPSPSSIDLTRHECARARDAGADYILAIVSGLGEGHETEVRFIIDPLRSAAWEPVRGITVKHIGKAKAVVIREAAPAAKAAG